MTYAERFAGKVVLVTGASSGIGRALALRLGKAGAKVGVVARRGERLRALAKELGDETSMMVLEGDISDEDFCTKAVGDLAEAYGKVDLIVNNAGISMNALFEEAELEVFHRMMNVNYFGSLHMAKAAMPHLERSGGGLVFVSSIVGKRGFATRSGYSASKFAVHALFESLRVEWADKGIHVGIIAPGYTDTEIREQALGKDAMPRRAEGKTAGDVMSAEDAAEAICKMAALRKREVILTRGGKFMVWLNKLLPAVADRVAASVVG
jgi:dehydrogenase/reductase SDR family member 7B